MGEIRQLVPGDEGLVEEFLLAWPETSLLVLSNLRQSGLAPGKTAYHGLYLGAFEEGRLTGFAALFWNGMLFIRAERFAADLACRLANMNDTQLAGLNGPPRQVAEVKAALGIPKHIITFESQLDVMTVELGRVVRPPILDEVTIRPRRARSSELDLVANWLAQFKLEVEHARESNELYGQALEAAHRLRRSRRLFVLERAGQLVACCGFSGVFENKVRLGYVWTPPGLRSCGYARAVVAGALELARREGYEEACLIADDPAALKAYIALGFRTIGKDCLLLIDREKQRLSA